jgi:hypothetical protein
LNIKYPEDQLEDPAGLMQAMKEAWMRQFSLVGGQNGKPGSNVKAPAFILGDVDVIKVQDTLRDIINKDLLYKIESRVCAEYGVPPSRFEFGLDHGGGNQSALKQERENFFNDAIAPQLEQFKSKIEQYIIPAFEEEGLEVEWDLSNMGIASFLEEKRKAFIFKRWELGVADLDETRIALHMNPLPGSEGKRFYRVSVMSDGMVNAPNTNKKPNSQAKPDNRTLTDPTHDRVLGDSSQGRPVGDSEQIAPTITENN